MSAIIAGGQGRDRAGSRRAPRKQLREQVAALAVAGAEKILRREVDAKAHADAARRLKKQL